jgi:hypothetical protein
MAATVLYVAQADLEVWSAVASWKAPSGSVLPLDPASPFTALLLAAGRIVLAPGNAVDTATPANIVRGQPGIKAPGSVSNLALTC